MENIELYLVIIGASKEDIFRDRGRRQRGGRSFPSGSGRLDTELGIRRPTGLTTWLALRCWKIIVRDVWWIRNISWKNNKSTERKSATAAQHLCNQLKRFCVWWKESSVTAPPGSSLSLKAPLHFHCINRFLDSHDATNHRHHWQLLSEPALVSMSVWRAGDYSHTEFSLFERMLACSE